MTARTSQPQSNLQYELSLIRLAVSCYLPTNAPDAQEAKKLLDLVEVVEHRSAA